MNSAAVPQALTLNPPPQDAFIRYPFGETDLTVVPSLIFVRPDDLENIRVLAGPDAQLGEELYPMRKSQLAFGNTKTLFKNDLVLSEKDPGWRYRFDRHLAFAECSPVTITEHFFRAFFEKLKGLGLEAIRKLGPLYIGKPAYSDIKAERLFEKRIKSVFVKLGLQPPVFVYEPYAVYYYCRFGLRMSFSKDNARKSSRILIVDHGGGTINTCVVEVDRHGEVKTSARPKSPQARMGGGSFIDQFMLRKKIREANFNHDLRRKLLESERLVFPRVAEVLSQVEKIKIMFSRGELKESRELTVNLGVPGTESWTFSISPSDVEEAFSYVWDRHGKIAIAATLGADDSKKIDYVILSGGTCHLGLHERYLNRDFGGYFKQSETSFVNISGEIKPVSFGLCFQGLLDRMEKGLQPKAVAAPAPQEAVTQELREEDLSDYVSRNLILTISGEADGGDKKFGEGVLVRSGSPKDALWNSERKVQLRLWKKPRRAFRFAIGPDDASEQPPEAGVVTIRHKMADVVEKTISVSFTVNEEGVCQPKFYLSPYQKPTYYEPDKETFKVLIPELAKAKSDPVQTPDRPETLGQAEAHLHTSAAADEDQILGFDFGTSMSALVGLDYAIGVETISK